jgi:DNA-binding MarR family transcriptional regulator
MKPDTQSGPGAAFLLAQVGAQAAARFGERLAVLGLSPPHAGILNTLGASAGLSQQALCARLSIPPSRLVALMDALEQHEIVERRDHPDDRRTYAIHLTEKGRRTLEAVRRVAREHDEAICAALDEKEREQLAALLRRIADDQGLIPGVHPGYRRPGG